jgi:MFS family permease
MDMCYGRQYLPPSEVSSVGILPLHHHDSSNGFVVGYDQGVMSNLLTTENFGANFPSVYADEDIKGWVVAILQLGAWLGALLNGPIAQKFSRKYSMIIAVAVFCFGSALQAGARNVDYLFAGRFFAGLSIGALSHVVPMYQSEVAPPEIRGSLVSLQQFAITVGILVSFWLDYGFHFIGMLQDHSVFVGRMLIDV